VAALFFAALAAPAQAYLVYSSERSFTPMIGGSGGEYLRTECNDGHYLGGLVLRYGNWIDAVSLDCANIVESKGALAVSSLDGGGFFWGGKGGAEAPLLCGGGFDGGDALVGMTVQRSPNNFVGYISILCRPLNNPASKPSPPWPVSGLGRISDKSPPPQSVMCPDGMLAVGIQGSTGTYVDRIGLVCAPQPTVAHETIGRGMEDNSDRPGADYRAVPLGVDPTDCQNLCVSDSGACRAWTYVRPGIQGPNAVCHLKNAQPAVVQNDCCISGTVHSASSVFSERPRSVPFPRAHSVSDGVLQKSGDRIFTPPQLPNSNAPLPSGSIEAPVCKSGFVWRVAKPDDLVCVPPETRDRTEAENNLAASRIDPNGAYGPQSCIQGFVWREAFPGDYVCVTPEIRALVQQENALGPSRTQGCVPVGGVGIVGK
jgi:hypothetical protein